jgi:hypothetical protein
MTFSPSGSGAWEAPAVHPNNETKIAVKFVWMAAGVSGWADAFGILPS